MTALQNNPLIAPIMTLQGIENYIQTVKVYATDADRMNDKLVAHCLHNTLTDLIGLKDELSQGYKVSNEQALRYCRLVDRAEALMYSAGLHEQTTSQGAKI